jgi:hypothetical protein
VLRHHQDPQRLHCSTAPSESGSIAGQHRHGRLLVLKALHHHILPAMAQYILYLPPVDTVVRDKHQCDAIAACYPSEADFTPSVPAPCHPVSGITQHTPKSADCIA